MGSGCGFGEQFDVSGNGHNDDTSLTFMAEQSIVNILLQGGNAADDLSDGVLRFIRYILSISRPAYFGFLPNFRDLRAVHEIARQFINYCGGSATALSTMSQFLDNECHS